MCTYIDYSGLIGLDFSLIGLDLMTPYLYWILVLNGFSSDAEHAQLRVLWSMERTHDSSLHQHVLATGAINTLSYQVCTGLRLGFWFICRNSSIISIDKVPRSYERPERLYTSSTSRRHQLLRFRMFAVLSCSPVFVLIISYQIIRCRCCRDHPLYDVGSCSFIATRRIVYQVYAVTMVTCLEHEMECSKAS